MSAHATPNRRPDVVRIDETEARWSKDHAAYRRLRAQGKTPDHVDGSAAVEDRL